MYHQESLKKGLATRATRYTSARFWHLNGNMLLCASENYLSIRKLRSAKNAPNSRSDTFHMSLVTLLGSSKSLHGAWLTASGDFILHIGADIDTVGLAAHGAHDEEYYSR